MTDEPPVAPRNETDLQAQDADEVSSNGSDGQPEPAVIRYRSADAEWRDLPVEQKSTGDPDLDRLWEMSFDEFQQIIDDESHQLHEKALQVQAEITKPMREALEVATKPVTDALRKGFDPSWLTRAVTPAIEFPSITSAFARSSWFTKLMPNLSTFEPSESITKQLSDINPVVSMPDSEGAYGRWIDLDASEPPDASMREIGEASEARAHEIRTEERELLRALLTQAQVDAEAGKDALEVSKSSKRAGWVAAWAASVAVVVGVIGIIVTILLSSGT